MGYYNPYIWNSITSKSCAGGYTDPLNLMRCNQAGATSRAHLFATYGPQVQSVHCKWLWPQVHHLNAHPTDVASCTRGGHQDTTIPSMKFSQRWAPYNSEVDEVPLVASVPEHDWREMRIQV